MHVGAGSATSPTTSTRLGTHDLAWWQLGTSMRRRATVIGLGVGVAVVAADMLDRGTGALAR